MSALPAALAPLVAERRWLVWRWEKDDKGKPTKVPYRADNSEIHASSTNPDTWSDHATAAAAVAAGKADGIGYALLSGVIGAFDLDNALDDAGEPLPWAWDLIRECGSYVERTVGGNGLRILGFVEGSKIHRKFKVPGTASSVEVYRQAERYIVVTGHALDGHGGELRNLDDAMASLVERLEAGRRASAKTTSVPAGPRTPKPCDGSDLSPSLFALIRDGVPKGERSEKFFYAVGALKWIGYDADDVEELLTCHLTGIAEKFEFRLRAEVERAFRKTEGPFDVARWFDLGPLFSDASETSRAASAARFVFETFDQAADKALSDGAPFLVKGLLDLGSMSVVYGDSNVGKTFVVMQIEHCVATGRPYAGKKVRQGAVLHLFTEGARGGRKRAEALRRSVGPAPQFYMLFGNVDLFDPSADIGPLIEAIASLGVSFCLIVIDTLARAMAGGDENSARDMGAFVRNVDRLRAATGAHAMLVHHSGKDASKGARGSGSLRAATDTEIEVTEGRITATKQRDIDKSWTSTFSLRVVELGRDEDGDLITSCTVRLGVDSEAAGEPDSGMAEVEEVRELSRLVALLKAIEREPKATVRRLGEIAKIPKSTVGKMLERLQRDKLASSTLGTWDLTPKGVKYLGNAT